MRFLFVHQNFPGQYQHVAPALAVDPANQVLAIGEAPNLQRRGALHPDIHVVGYSLGKHPVTTQNTWLSNTEAALIRGQVVAHTAMQLKNKGFIPDVIAGHPGWGETLFLRDVFPGARIISYCEFYYRSKGADVGFDPEFPPAPDSALRQRTRNFTHLSAIESADQGIAPTRWQRSLFPLTFRPKIQVIHDGIDTRRVRPNPEARFKVAGITLRPGDPVITYVARNLEPYRGFHAFMRALPKILSANPQAQILIVGGDEVSYGAPRTDGKIYREAMTEEIGNRADWNRVHFLGRVPYTIYLQLLQVSALHVYLTYPFVLSWSLLESMAAGCLVLASDTAPLHDVIRDGENGLLTDFFNAEDLADKAIQCLNNPTALTHLRSAARDTVVEQFDLKNHCLPSHLAILKGDTPSMQ